MRWASWRAWLNIVSRASLGVWFGVVGEVSLSVLFLLAFWRGVVFGRPTRRAGFGGGRY